MRKDFAAISVLIIVAILFAGYFMKVDNTGFSASGKIRIATGGESGIYYAFGDSLASLLENQLKMTVTVIPSGGSVDNINLLRNSRTDIAFVQNDIMTYAYNGTNLFSTEGQFQEFGAIASLYPESCQVVARRNIINDIIDLKGKRVSIGAEGSGTELNALQILDSYGINYADVNVDHLGFSASVNAFREGKIDAFFCTAGVPTPAVSELTEAGEAYILSVGEAHASLIISQYPFYSRQIIPKGVYPGIDEDVETVAVKATLVASSKLSENTILEIMKIIFDNSEEIVKDVPGISLSRSSATEGLSVPLHPGAEKFLF
ncbi:MAG: TAXI family TRAP transporter solute-binding subunit [Synergistaceae bacterium]|nr:TAXI family TRAP transporter solute-binding subunit [Synergistaceae bacterium]